MEGRFILKSYRRAKPSPSNDKYPDVNKMLLDEWEELRQKIVSLGSVGGDKHKRLIEKWNRVDDDCAMRGIKVPFDA